MSGVAEAVRVGEGVRVAEARVAGVGHGRGRPELSLPAQGRDTSVHRCGLLKGWGGEWGGTEVSDPDAGASAGGKIKEICQASVVPWEQAHPVSQCPAYHRGRR